MLDPVFDLTGTFSSNREDIFYTSPHDNDVSVSWWLILALHFWRSVQLRRDK